MCSRAVGRLGVESGAVSVLERAAVRFGRRVLWEYRHGDVSHVLEGGSEVLTVFCSGGRVSRLGIVGVLGE